MTDDNGNPERPIFSQMEGLGSDKELYAATVAMQTMNVVLQGMMRSGCPAKALALATVDTFVDACDYMVHLAGERHGDVGRNEAHIAIGYLLQIVTEYFLAQSKAETTNDVDVDALLQMFVPPGKAN